MSTCSLVRATIDMFLLNEKNVDVFPAVVFRTGKEMQICFHEQEEANEYQNGSLKPCGDSGVDDEEMNKSQFGEKQKQCL